MNKFDITQYVPLLRWKRAERVALRRLRTDIRSLVTPILELVPTVKNSTSELSVDITRDWGFAPFFLELVNLNAVRLGNFLLSLDDALRRKSLHPIPVTGIGRPADFQIAAAHIASHAKVSA